MAKEPQNTNQCTEHAPPPVLGARSWWGLGRRFVVAPRMGSFETPRPIGLGVLLHRALVGDAGGGFVVSGLNSEGFGVSVGRARLRSVLDPRATPSRPEPVLGPESALTRLADAPRRPKALNTRE